MDMIINYVKRVELNTKIVSVILNTLKMIQYYTNVYVAIEITEISFMKTQKKMNLPIPRIV